MTSAPRAPQRRADRRVEILQVARRLFAAEGVGQVTAGRIAKEASISSGNLYYWFASKEDIVRTLFREWLRVSAIGVELPADPPGMLAMLWHRSDVQRQVNADYAFFHRELATVLESDSVLAAEYRAVYTERVEQFAVLAESLIAAGLLRRPEPPTTVRALVRVLWLVAETADPFARAIADPELDPTELTRSLLAPFLTDTGRAALAIGERTRKDRDGRRP